MDNDESIVRLALNRLRNKAQARHQDIILQKTQWLHELDEVSLLKTLNTINGDQIDVLHLCCFCDTSVIEVEVMLAKKTEVDEHHLLESTTELLQFYLTILKSQLADAKSAEEISQYERHIFDTNCFLTYKSVDAYKAFWRKEGEFTSMFTTFMRGCFTVTTCLQHLNHILLINPKVYRACVGLKSEYTQIDVLTNLVEKYTQLPKLRLWHAYDNVISKTQMTDEEMYQKCFIEFCIIMNVPVRLLKHDIEKQDAAALLKWGQQIYKTCLKNGGVTIFEKFTKHLDNQKNVLSILASEIKPLAETYTALHKDKIFKLFKSSGKEIFLNVMQQIFDALSIDQSLQTKMYEMMATATQS